MFRIVSAILFIVFISDVSCQFYDFFSAFQPLVQSSPRSLQFDVTTKRTRNDLNTTKHEPVRTANNERTAISINIEELNRDGDKERHKQNSQNIARAVTTVKPLKKTTTRDSSPNYGVNITKESSRNKAPKDRALSSYKSNKKQTVTDNIRTDNSRSHNDARKESNIDMFNDRLTYEDGNRRSMVNYDLFPSRGHTTKSYHPEYELKKYQNSHQTQYPFTIRPGVKPPIVNGPPITNRPATKRPKFGPRPAEDDLSVSPELIIGPNEDFMNIVEKKQYIEMAERMCDKYKAIDVKQIQAIPLVPSPDVVKVNVSSCEPTTIPLVVGGKVVTVKEFPHMALLGWPKLQYGGYSWKCGGSLLSNRYVLTAAHCVYQEKDYSVVTGAPRAVQLGSSYLDDPNAVVMKVAAVIRHPKYKLPKSYYDLAVVKMTSTVTFSSVIRPACLGIPPPPGDPIIASGWGMTEFGGEQSQELRSVSVPIWEMSECYSVLGTSRKIPDGPSSDSQICAGEKRGGKDTCQGDSGGPAQIQDGCIWRVVAVTSLGRSCGAAHTPALYALVQRAFVSAVVFGDQIDKQPPVQTSNNHETNNNQWSNQQWNNNQQTNTERIRYQQNVHDMQSTGQLGNNPRNNHNNGDLYQQNSGTNQQSNNHRQQSNGQHHNNNKVTTTRTVYNKPENVYYNDYGDGRVPDYQADGNSYSNGGRVWWT